MKHETLETYGAVSEQTAAEMALGAAKADTKNARGHCKGITVTSLYVFIDYLIGLF